MSWERVRQENQQVALGDSSSGPGKISAHTCNAIRGGRFIYVFGGFDRDDRLTNQVHVFDAETQLWTQPVINGLPPCPRDSHSCTTVQDNLFVFGGTNATNYLKDLHILDTSSHTWRCPDVRGEGPEAREAHSAALVDKRLFIFGGVGGTSISDDEDDDDEVLYDDLYILNTETFVWERAITSGNPPSERGSHTCTTWKNKIVVVGGQDLHDCFLSDVYILDTDTFVWIELNTSGQLLTPRAGHVTVAHESNLFVFGGYTYSQNLYNDLYVLDLETGEWSKIFFKEEGPSARFSAAAACLDAHFFFFLGGCNNKLVSLDDVYYLHLEGGYVSCVNQNQGMSSLRKQMKLKCNEPRLTRTNIQYCQHPDPNIMHIFEESTYDWLYYDSIIAVFAVAEDLRLSTAPAEDEIDGIEGLYVYEHFYRLDSVSWGIREDYVEGFGNLRIQEAESIHYVSMQRLHRRIYSSVANSRFHLVHYRWIDIVVGVDSGDEEEEDVEDEDGGDDDEDGGDEDELWEEHVEDGHEYRPVDIAVRQACLAMDLHGDPHYGPSPAAATCSVTGTTGYIAPGLEKAEKEVVVLKQQLDASVSKVSALEDRNNNLDSALKECVRQLWQGREEQNQKIEEAITKKCVGKSTLLTMLTGTHSEAASYEFTTLTCIPGVIHYNDTKIQLLDLPGIIEGVSEGRGRGRQVIVVAKSSDLVLMVLDASKSEGHRQILTKELEAVGLRLNKRPPQIYIKKKKTGGISFNTTTPLTRIDEKLCYQILHEYKIHNAEVLFREDARVDDFIDVIEGNRKYIKCVYVYNKIDVGIADVDRLARQPNSIVISCNLKLNLDRLLAQMWDEMGLVRVYTKPQGQQPDFDEPFVLSADRGDCTVEDFCIDKMFTPHHN